MVLLFLWRGIEVIGTHDLDREVHRDRIMGNAVTALLRRNEITREEAQIADPIEIKKRAMADRLDSLGLISRQVVEREMVVEELVQANRREFGLLR